jgi:phasin family protein
MITETISALTEPTKGVLEPVQKLNQQAVTTVEKLAARQMDSLKAYSDLGVSQLKIVAEVKDVEGLQNLVSKQVDFLRAFGECLMSDIKAVAQIGVDFVSQATRVGADETAAAPAKTQGKAA